MPTKFKTACNITAKALQKLWNTLKETVNNMFTEVRSLIHRRGLQIARNQCKEHYQLQSSLEETRYLQQLSWYAASVAGIKQSEFNAQTVPISIKLCIAHSQEGVDVQDWQQKHHTITDSKNSMQGTLPIAIKPWGNQVLATTVNFNQALHSP